MGTALVITAIGMTLLFLTLAFFYVLLSLMARVMEERRPSTSSPAAAPPITLDGAAPLRAAAIAVALARATAEESVAARRPLPEPAPSPGTSPWWALHHQRSLGPNSPARRTR